MSDIAAQIDLFGLKIGESHKVVRDDQEIYVFEVDGKQVFRIMLDNEKVTSLRPRELEKMTGLLSKFMKQFHDLIAFSKNVNIEGHERSEDGDAPELPNMTQKGVGNAAPELPGS